MGFILSAAGIGGLIYAPSTRALLANFGAAWTLRALGLVNLLIGLSVSLATPPSRSNTRRPTLVSYKLLKKPTFILSAVGAMSQAGGYFIPLTFLPEFSTRLGYSAAFGTSLLVISNAVNTVSRIAMGSIADVAGRQNTLIVSVVLSAGSVVAFWMTSATGYDGGLWIAFVVAYGICAGGENH